MMFVVFFIVYILLNIHMTNMKRKKRKLAVSKVLALSLVEFKPRNTSLSIVGAEGIIRFQSVA